MHQAAIIALRPEPVGDAVQHPWERVLELPERLRRPLPSEKKVGEVFSDVGALLIMGEPGAGKTVTLLELARDLLDRFEADPGQPLPVVLHLSFWREARGSRTNSTPFSIWVEAEMKDKYYVPARRTHAWLAKSRLCLLLDGLDEVRVQERAGCVRAINEFIREVGVSGIAVCSRVTEYVAIGERLRFSGAIRIQPLTEQQIDEYLERAGSGLTALRHEVQKDPVLQDLARSPLMLSVMALAYQSLPSRTSWTRRLLQWKTAASSCLTGTSPACSSAPHGRRPPAILKTTRSTGWVGWRPVWPSVRAPCSDWKTCNLVGYRPQSNAWLTPCPRG